MEISDALLNELEERGALKLTPAERERVKSRLGRVLAHAGALPALDPAEAGLLRGGTVSAGSLRPDRAETGSGRPFEGAPEAGEYFTAPKIQG